MRIELNRFDNQGAVSTSFVELTQEEVRDIVQRAHDVTRLRREGQPLDNALDSLDQAMVNAKAIESAPVADPVKPAVPATTHLVDAFATLRKSVKPNELADGTVVVSQAALDAVGDALRAAVDGSGVSSWKWTKVAAPGAAQEVQSHDLQRVLEMMSRAASLGGAPSVKEAMTQYPLLFCQAFSQLVEQDERAREQNANATTIVHLDNGDPRSMVSLGAPAGMSEMDVRAAVQAAVVASGNYEDIPKQLAGAGFEQIEHITINVPAGPADDFDLEPEAPR
jgi:D-mannonate dehydratase